MNSVTAAAPVFCPETVAALNPGPVSSEHTFLGFRTRLLVTNEKQKTYFCKACGTSRFAYNWALKEWQRMYEEHKQDPSKPLPSGDILRKKLNAIKKKEFPWMLEVTSRAARNGVEDLEQAFENFFNNPDHFEYPKPRRKFVDDSFRIPELPSVVPLI